MTLQGEVLQSVIDNAPNYRNSNSPGFGPSPYGCTTIDLRRYSDRDNIYLSEPLVIPKNKSIVLDGGEHSQTRITTINSGPSIFVEGGMRVAQVRGVLLFGGGIEFEGGVNRFWGMEDSSIVYSDTAIKVSGPSAVNGRFRNLMLRGNVVNVDIRQEQTNLIKFEDCEFLQTLSPSAGVLIASSNITFVNCAWERAVGEAHIQLFGRTPGESPNRIARSVSFICPRFGPEGFNQNQVPKYIFKIGNDIPSGDVIVGIKCQYGDFSRGAIDAVIKQTAPMINAEFSQINNCTIPNFVESHLKPARAAKNAHNWIVGEPIAKGGWDGWCRLF